MNEQEHSHREPGVSSARPANPRPLLLGLLFATYVCSFVDRSILATLGPQVVAELDLTDLQFGLLGGFAFALFYSAFGLPLAWLAERVNRVALISACVAVWSAMTALCGAATSYWQLLLFRSGVGIGEAGCTPPAHSLISDHFPPHRRGAALAVYSLGVPIGILLGAVAGGVLAERFGWRWALVAVGAPGLGLALVVLLALREPLRGTWDGRAPRAADRGRRLRSHGAGLRRLLGDPALRQLGCGISLAAMAGNAVALFLPSFIRREFGLGLDEIGLLYGVAVGVSGAAGTLLGGFGGDRFGGRDPARMAFFAAGCAAAAAPLHFLGFSTPHLAVTVGLLALGIVAMAASQPPTFTLGQNLVDPRLRATISALFLLFMNAIGLGVGPVVIGWLSGHFGLRGALVASSALYLWSSAHYLLAARALRARADGRPPAVEAQVARW